MKFFEITFILISAVLLILSFLPAANLELIGWFAFLPLFFALGNKSAGRAFFVGYVCGIIFWLGAIYWLIHVTLAGLILLVLYLGLYFGLFGLIIARFSLLSSRYSLFSIPSLWVLLEYLRSHLLTGFGWALLGYSQYLNLPVIQIADISGTWGVSFLLMMVNVGIWQLISEVRSSPSTWLGAGKQPLDLARDRETGRRSVFSSLLFVLCVLGVLGYGFYKLRSPQDVESATLKISVVQGNIPQAIKWQAAARDEILKEYLRLSRLASGDNPDLIIWPESALPGIWEEESYLKQRLEAFVGDIQIPILLGAVIRETDNYYNSAILINQQNKSAQRYDKLHLVPFGEYIPLKKMLGFLETVVPIGDFISGKEYVVFSLAAAPRPGSGQESNPSTWLGAGKQEAGSRKQEARNFSVLICFEDIFPEISRRFVKRGADFLVNITNDAWFGDTPSPYQHLSASVLRAVENRVYLARAANTGVSGFISPEGRIEALIENNSGKPIFISGYKTREIILNPKQNRLYTRWGDWFIIACGIILIYSIFKKSRE